MSHNNNNSSLPDQNYGKTNGAGKAKHEISVSECDSIDSPGGSGSIHKPQLMHQEANTGGVMTQIAIQSMTDSD